MAGFAFEQPDLNQACATVTRGALTLCSTIISAPLSNHAKIAHYAYNRPKSLLRDHATDCDLPSKRVYSVVVVPAHNPKPSSFRNEQPNHLSLSKRY